MQRHQLPSPYYGEHCYYQKPNAAGLSIPTRCTGSGNSQMRPMLAMDSRFESGGAPVHSFAIHASYLDSSKI